MARGIFIKSSAFSKLLSGIKLVGTLQLLSGAIRCRLITLQRWGQPFRQLAGVSVPE